MTSRNLGICGKCRKRVPAEHVVRDGKVYLHKQCASCGTSESLVSNDAAVWQHKRDVWQYEADAHRSCSLQCDSCRVDHHPTIVFLDVTNRCNMNCPICIANVHSMGFDFHPPLDYFEKVFREISTYDPKPMVQLFGGEPTMREDLVDIVNLARTYGLGTRIVTNGLRLADEAYCRKLCDAKVHFRFAFDGPNREVYERLRKNPDAYDKKVKALANLKKWSKRKNTILCCAARNVNEEYIGDLIQLCHDNMDIIDEFGLLPLTENWEEGSCEFGETTTCEDAERMVAQAVPDGEVEFFPAGLLHGLRTARSFFRRGKRARYLMLGGNHPNCETMAFLISDGRRYRSANHYLKMRVSEITTEIPRLARALEPKLARLDPTKRFQRLRGQLLAIRAYLPLVVRAIDLRRIFRGSPLTALLKILGGLARGGRPRDVFTSHLAIGRVLPVYILPFAEHRVIDAQRLFECTAVFAYEDVETGRIRTSPACTWDLYRDQHLRRVSEKYGTMRKPSKEGAISHAETGP